MILDEMHLRDADEAWRRKHERNANGGKANGDNRSSGGQPKSEGAAADEADAQKEKARPSTQAERLIALARGSVELLYHDQERAYADIRVGGHRETWPVNSKRFRLWLKRLYYVEHSKAPNAEAVQEALDNVEAAALFEGKERQVELRVASHAGRIYIDLGSDDWRTLEIDEDGWRVIDDPPVRFRRPSGMRPLPEPARGGDISRLRSFANVKHDADFVLVVCWLLAAMRDRGPYPVLAINGEQGTAKSTLVAILRALIDPNASPLRAVPRENRELFIQANNGWVLAFDNVSSLPAWTSDSLCRLSNGGGFAVRQLHTDLDEILFDACRPIVLNGIADMVGQADLADRAIFITLEPIPEAERRAEDELWTDVRRELPGILGVLCDALSHGLRYRDLVKLKGLPRMADFAKWAIACEGAFWRAGTFQAAYDDNQHGANDAVLDADDVALAVKGFVLRCGQWEGTPSSFKEELETNRFGEDKHRPKGWPATASAMSSRLRRAATSLRRAGIEVDSTRTGKRRTRKITIRAVEHSDNGLNSPPASSASPNGSKNRYDGNDFRVDDDFARPSSACCPPEPIEK